MDSGNHDLETLKNIGVKSADRMRAVGIYSRTAVAARGAAATYLAVKLTSPHETSLNLLWALQGGRIDGNPLARHPIQN